MSQGQWVTDLLPVCGRLQCELQGQAVEGRRDDLSFRIELSLVSRRPLVPPSLCTLSYFEGEEHFSHCLHAHILADLCRLWRVLTQGYIYTQKTFRFTYKSDK